MYYKYYKSNFKICPLSTIFCNLCDKFPAKKVAKKRHQFKRNEIVEPFSCHCHISKLTKECCIDEMIIRSRQV